MRRPARLLAAAALAAVALLPAAPARAATFGPDDMRVVATQQVSPRLTDYTVTTPAMAGPVHFRVLLPEGYAQQPRRRYPVLFLLHGGLDSYTSWTTKGDVEAITRPYPLIVVMPADGDGGGWNVDWYNGGRGGPPMYETWHLGQILPWVDQHFRTDGDRDHRAVAGLSTGGFGTMHFATKRPDLWAFAASFSGADDVVGNFPVAPVIGFEAMVDGGTPDDVFGNRVTHEIGWRAQNPVDLAENVVHGGPRLWIATGDGQHGPFDDGPGFDPVEFDVRDMSLNFAHRLDALGKPFALWDYGPGTHSWPYWQRDLRTVLPLMMQTFADPPPLPRQVTYRAVDPDVAVYGWRLHVAQLAPAFWMLSGADRTGFDLHGTGHATVTTPPAYRPGATATVTVGELGDRRTLTVAPDGRLTIELPLGPRADTPATTRVTIRASYARPARRSSRRSSAGRRATDPATRPAKRTRPPRTPNR